MHFRFLKCTRVFVALLFAMLPLSMQAQDLYTVAALPIDARAENAAAARDIAISAGQKQAFSFMMQRLTHRQDHPRLPPAGAVDLSRLIDGIRVENEKTSPTRYLADLTVIFRPEPIRQLLRAGGFALTERQADRTLVLPVLSLAGSFDLFADTLWDAAWREAVNGPVGIIPWTLAAGDAADRIAVEPLDALRLDLERLDPLLQRYQAAHVMTALVSLSGQEDTITEAAVEASYAGGSGIVRTGFQAQPEAGEEAPDFLRRLAVAVMQELEDTWKAEFSVSYTESGRLVAVVPFNQLTDWTETRDILAANPRISGIEVLSYGRRDATLTLTYAGSVERLQASLAQDRLRLQSYDDFWYLLPRGVQVPATPPAGYAIGTQFQSDDTQPTGSVLNSSAGKASRFGASELPPTTAPAVPTVTVPTSQSSQQTEPPLRRPGTSE